MLNRIIKNILYLAVLVLIQVLIVKNINLGAYIHPFLYVLFILMLPFDTPKWLLLVSGFVLGIFMDMFYDTQGMHAAACVFMAYCRPWVRGIFAPHGGYDLDSYPTVLYMGWGWFLSYGFVLILLHHLLLFYIEAAQFDKFFSTLLRVLLSTISSLLFVVVGQFLFYRKKGK